MLVLVFRGEGYGEDGDFGDGDDGDAPPPTTPPPPSMAPTSVNVDVDEVVTVVVFFFFKRIFALATKLMFGVIWYIGIGLCWMDSPYPLFDRR